MMGWFFGSVEAVAISASLAALTSLAVLLALPRARAIVSAARRADAVFLLGLLPLAVAFMSWTALMLPPVLHATGLRVDHCGLHGHHAHLCAFHSGGHHIALVALGALSLAIVGWRAAGLGLAQWKSTRVVSKLESLGVPDGRGRFPVISVPGSPWLCLAVGGRRPRVIVSRTLVHQLPPHHVIAALAHENAHLERRDPVVKMLLAWAGLFAVPFAGRALQDHFCHAAEEASDAAAARVVGAVDLAESLVSAARIFQSSVPATGMALGGSSLERRVAVLLRGNASASPSRSAIFGAGLAIASLVAIPLTGDTLHHSVETLLGLFV